MALAWMVGQLHILDIVHFDEAKLTNMIISMFPHTEAHKNDLEDSMSLIYRAAASIDRTPGQYFSDLTPWQSREHIHWSLSDFGKMVGAMQEPEAKTPFRDTTLKLIPHRHHHQTPHAGARKAE